MVLGEGGRLAQKNEAVTEPHSDKRFSLQGVRLLVVAAIVVPFFLGVVLFAQWTLPDVFNFVGQAPLIGGFLIGVVKGIDWMYTLHLSAGSAGGEVVPFGLYPILALAFGLKKRYVAAAIVLFVPLILLWLLSASLQD